MKKMKILKTLSLCSCIGAATPIVATSCTNKTNFDAAIEIDTLNWVKRAGFYTDVTTDIKAAIIEDNEQLFNQYPSLLNDITVNTQRTDQTIAIIITAASGSFSGTVEWAARYLGDMPPSLKIDLGCLNWRMRPEYGSNNLDTIKTTIKSDNTNIFEDWTDVTFDVTVKDTAINVFVFTTSSKRYSGTIKWNSKYVPAKTDISIYKFRMRGCYFESTIDGVKVEVKYDNSSIFTDWNNVNLRVNMVGTMYISVIIDTSSSTKYTGEVSWSARCTDYALTHYYIKETASGQTYKTSNNTGTLGWYRVYTDGWIEQGGLCTVPSGQVTVTFMKAFKNTQNNTYASATNPSGSEVINVYSRTATTMTLDYYGSGSGGGCFWWACGY